MCFGLVYELSLLAGVKQFSSVVKVDKTCPNSFSCKLASAIFWDAFGYPGQLREAARWGWVSRGPITLRLATEKEVLRASAVAQRAALSVLQTQNDWVRLSCFEFWPLRARMTAEACPTGQRGWDLCPLQWQKRAVLIAVNHGLLTRSFSFTGMMIFSFQSCELLFYTVNQMPFISSPAPMWKNNNNTALLWGTATMRCSCTARNRLQKTRDNQCQAANSARAFSVGWSSASIRYSSIFTWFIVGLCKGLRKSLVDKCPGYTNIKMYLRPYFSNHFSQGKS